MTAWRAALAEVTEQRAWAGVDTDSFVAQDRGLSLPFLALSPDASLCLADNLLYPNDLPAPTRRVTGLLRGGFGKDVPGAGRHTWNPARPHDSSEDLGAQR